MASASLPSEEPTYDNATAFFEAMDYDDGATMNPNLLQYHAASQFEPFKGNHEVTGPTGPLLDNQFNGFNLDTNYWNGASQLAALDLINPILSPLDSNQSCDTGYVSQEGSSTKSPVAMPPLAYIDTMTINPSKTTATATKPRNKRSNTKKADSKQKDAPAQSPRKSRRTSKAASVEMVAPDDDDPKREQFLARNREAASKCRQKKKVWTQDLEERARDLASQKQMLTTYLAMLKNELLMLKCKCLEHSDCDCEAIREYLKTTVNTMSPANTSLYSHLNGANASDINGEIARKQSAAFDKIAFNPEDMVMTPSTEDGSTAGDEFLNLEAKLQEAVED